MTDTKLCKDCKHFYPKYVGVPSACGRPLSERLDPVHGTADKQLRGDPWKERRPGRTLLGRERCGPEGKFFVQKSKFFVQDR